MMPRPLTAQENLERAEALLNEAQELLEQREGLTGAQKGGITNQVRSRINNASKAASRVHNTRLTSARKATPEQRIEAQELEEKGDRLWDKLRN